MSKTSSRRLVHTPLPLDQSAKVASVSAQERENSLRGDDRALANVDTQKSSVLTQERPLNDSALINEQCF